jgi:hypothetical protein
MDGWPTIQELSRAFGVVVVTFENLYHYLEGDVLISPLMSLRGAS